VTSNLMKMRKVAYALVVGTAFVGLLMYFYLPAVPHSALGWIALIGLGLPVWMFLEWLGEFVFDSRLFRGRSSGFRIVVGVPVFIVVACIAMVCVWLVQAAILAA